MADNVSNVKYLILILLFFVAPWKLQAQMDVVGIFRDSIAISPENKGVLGLSIDNISFFKNNESDGDILDGYTLPGFRLLPRIIYYPTSFVKLEAGVSLLRYWGADKYPCYAYHDIAEWKADGYQPGFHLLPFFRAQIQPIKQINIVLGTIYGGSNHCLIEPLYNPELNLTADPESGVQFLYNSRVAGVDVWVNWDSFTFRDETHNEAFTLGGSSCLNITDPQSFLYLGVPLQAVMTHRGGEIDSIEGNIATMTNGAAGLCLQMNFNDKFLKSIRLDLMGAGYRCLAGSENLPFPKGWAVYSNLTANVGNMKFKAAYWRSNDFINLFGNPVFGNISYTLPGRTFEKTDIFDFGLAYEHDFGSGFYLGADAEVFYNPKLVANDPSVKHVKISKSSNFSMGVYLRINPSITLKKIFLN